MATGSRRSLIKTTGAPGATALPIGARCRAVEKRAVLEISSIPAPANPNHPICAADAAKQEAGVRNYIDKQLAGAWGAGERLYRSGPWQPGVSSQGYQLPSTPAELFRTADRALMEHTGGRRADRSNRPHVKCEAEAPC